MAARDHALVRNLPNALTLLRLLAVPVFVALVVVEGGAHVVAGLVFMAAAFTDFFDGYIARKAGVMSQFGKIADPLADRLLVSAAAILLCVYDSRMQGWEFLVVIWRDVLAVYGFMRARRRTLPEVSRTGKWATALMMAGLAWLLVLPGELWPIYPFWIGMLLSVVALAQYVRRYRWVLDESAPGAGEGDVYSGADAAPRGEENGGAPS